MNSFTWYQTLIKPFWAPPAWLFGPVWTVLYVIMAISFGAIFYKTLTKQIQWKVTLPFVLNLVFNFAFTPIQFGLKNNFLAMLDIFFVIGTLVWSLYQTWRVGFECRWIVYVNIPYLIWVAFATILQVSITYLNW